MAWAKVKKSNFVSSEPLISLNNNRFSYNTVFSKIAELEKNRFVTYWVDDENRKIGFEFNNIERQDTYQVTVNKTKGNYSQSNELFSKKWIQAISKTKDANRFKPIPEGKKFVITLMPVFEISVLRTEKLKIPADACGIYRYIDNGNIVYIGKGNIRDRLKELSRKDWKFDSIEYSVIGSEKSQYEWEKYWLENFKEKSQNKLPAYNFTSGNKS